MFDRIDTLRMASSLTAHASARQGLAARNVANADTPGFRAHDLGRFAETYRSAPATELRATRPGHASGISWGGPDRAIGSAVACITAVEAVQTKSRVAIPAVATT